MADSLKYPQEPGQAAMAERVCLLAAYTLSFGLMLLCNGLYQDDWTLYNMDPATVRAIFHYQGHRWLAAFHNLLLANEHAVYLYRALIFAAYLLQAFILGEILRKLNLAGSEEKFFLVLCFAVFPVNNVRFLLINAPYAVGSCAFWAACWALIRCQEATGARRELYRLGSLLLFFIAFDTNSLLLFYLLPLTYLLHESFRPGRSPGAGGIAGLLKTVCRHLDFILLPLAYWLPKTLLFAPYGDWTGYNQLTAASLALSPLFLARSFQTSFFTVIDYSLASFGSAALALSALAAAALRSRWQAGRPPAADTSRRDCLLLGLGIFAFCLAVLPYNLVGLLPKLDNWHSRHQLLVPLGASLVLVYGLRLLGQMLNMGAFARTLVMSLLVCQFIATNVADCVGLQLDWFRQQALIIQMRENPLFADNRTFIFDDRAQPAGMIKRTYPVYQYAGMMKLTFGDQKRIGLDSTLVASGDYRREIGRQQKYFSPLWNAGEYVPAAPDYLVVVEPGRYKADRLSKVLSLKYYELYDPPAFRETVKDIIALRFVRL